jgi:monomeric sarcosine oxidase
MDADVDVVIVGGGLMGAATANSAARRGMSVALVEQFAAGHQRGSSHGSARIVRRGYGDALYTRLSGRALELWREVELASGKTLLRMTGGVDFGPARDVPAVAGHLAAEGVPHEVLDAREAERRWPGMRFSGRVAFHREAGTVDAESAVATLLELAARRGAVVRHEAKVRSIDADDPGVTLADGTGLRGRCVVVAAGAWLEPLLGGHMSLPPLRVTQQQIFHFPRLDPSAPPWPSVIHEDARGVYHLAGGRDGGPDDDRKIGEHDAGRSTTADGRDGVVDPASRSRMIEYVRRWLPGLDPSPRSEATCLYTSTTSEDFLVDRVGPLVVCSPCSGHGAKFAPLIGELTADLAQGRTSELPDRFRLGAHALGRDAAVSL